MREAQQRFHPGAIHRQLPRPRGAFGWQEFEFWVPTAPAWIWEAGGASGAQACGEGAGALPAARPRAGAKAPHLGRAFKPPSPAPPG